MLCFYRWSAQGKFFGRLGEDSISIYETPVSCHPEYSPKNRSLCGNIFSHFCREVFILKYCGKRKVLSNRWILSMSDFTLYIITVVVIFSSLFSLHFVLTRRICVTIRRFLIWWSFPFFLITFTFDSRVRLTRSKMLVTLKGYRFAG